MTVGEFVGLAGDDYIFEVVDATKQGNRTFPNKCLFHVEMVLINLTR